MDKLKSIAVPVKRRDAAGTRSRKARTPGAADVAAAGIEFRRQPQPTTARLTHRYSVGERLAMARGSRDIARAAAACEVIALLPRENGPLRYRVRSDDESFERIVDEIDLAPFANGLD